MADRMEVFQLIGEASSSIFPLAGEIMPAQFEQHFSEQRFYGPTFLAYQLAPQPLTVERLRQRNPYGNITAQAEVLKEAAQAGYLESAGKGAFQISDQARAAIDTVHQVFYDHINDVNQIPGDELRELAGILGKLVDSISAADPESGAFCFRCARSGHPPVRKGSLGEVDQLLDDLNAFRDDAHLAAWLPTGVSGQVWESLTLIWNGTARTAEELVESLPYRNFSVGDYQAALDELEGLGWIEKAGQEYQLTAIGKARREKAEEETDANFFGPWEILSPEELSRLGELLGELRNTNQAML